MTTYTCNGLTIMVSTEDFNEELFNKAVEEFLIYKNVVNTLLDNLNFGQKQKLFNNPECKKIFDALEIT